MTNSTDEPFCCEGGWGFLPQISRIFTDCRRAEGPEILATDYTDFHGLPEGGRAGRLCHGKRGHDHRNSSIRSGKSVKIRVICGKNLRPPPQQGVSSDDALPLQGACGEASLWDSKRVVDAEGDVEPIA